MAAEPKYLHRKPRNWNLEPKKIGTEEHYASFFARCGLFVIYYHDVQTRPNLQLSLPPLSHSLSRSLSSESDSLRNSFDVFVGIYSNRAADARIKMADTMT